MQTPKAVVKEEIILIDNTISDILTSLTYQALCIIYRKTVIKLLHI